MVQNEVIFLISRECKESKDSESRYDQNLVYIFVNLIFLKFKCPWLVWMEDQHSHEIISIHGRWILSCAV